MSIVVKIDHRIDLVVAVLRPELARLLDQGFLIALRENEHYIRLSADPCITKIDAGVAIRADEFKAIHQLVFAAWFDMKLDQKLLQTMGLACHWLNILSFGS